MAEGAERLARHAWPVRRQARVVLLVALTVVALGILCQVLLRAGEQPVAQPARGGIATDVHLSSTQLATLSIETVATQAFRTEVQADGRIALDADRATAVFSEYSGRVVRVFAGLGERVAAGAPLLAIEASELAQAEGDLANALSQSRLTRLNEARRRAAYESRGGSLQDWQQSQADLSAAETQLATARNRLRILGASSEQIAAIEQTRSSDPVAQVRAPIAGVVIDRQVGPGQYVQAGAATPVYTVGDISRVWLVASVREEDSHLIAPGQPVEVRVPALPGRVLLTTVATIGASVDPLTHRVAVRATLANPDGVLRPDMFAHFNILASAPTQAPAVPEAAVVREGEQARVWVLKDRDALALREIRTGRIHEGMVEVLAGLRAGERVVTRGSLFVDQAAQP